MSETIIQGTTAWFNLRCGRATGSHCVDIMDFLKSGKESKAREHYRAKIVAELLTGEINMDGYLTPAMLWGSEMEPLARAAYEVRMGKGYDVDIIGFVLHPTIDRMAGSPDGLIGTDGGIEIKAPNTSTHIRWTLAGVVPPEHEPQMMFYMAITGRKWMDFVSFDPRLPERHQLFIVRLHRNEKRIAEIEDHVRQFNAEVVTTIEEMERINPEIVRAEPAKEDFGELGLTDADIDQYIPAEKKP